MQEESSVKLALRRGPAEHATFWQKLASWTIKARLVSQYSHAGIVIDGRLFHATSSRGLHVLEAGEWSPEKWDLVTVKRNNEEALSLFSKYEGAAYDWFSLLAFVGLGVRDSRRMYCFEWCWLAMTGTVPTKRITPEMLLLNCVINQSDR